MQKFISSKIALVGVSADPDKYGYKIFRDLLTANYKVTGINLKGEKILGQEIFSSLSKLDFVPNLVVVVVPPQIALAILRECLELKIKNVWMQPGSESDEAIEIAKASGINLVTKKCIMVEEGLWPE